MMRTLWRNPNEGLKKKIKFEENIALHEVFLESVPASLIITYICVQSFGMKFLVIHSMQVKSDYNYLPFHTVPGGDSSISYTVVGNRTLFLTTYITSILSAVFGLAKCLKTGVARIIQSKGPLDGYLSCRFILAFFGK